MPGVNCLLSNAFSVKNPPFPLSFMLNCCSTATLIPWAERTWLETVDCLWTIKLVLIWATCFKRLFSKDALRVEFNTFDAGLMYDEVSFFLCEMFRGPENTQIVKWCFDFSVHPCPTILQCIRAENKVICHCWDTFYRILDRRRDEAERMGGRSKQERAIEDMSKAKHNPSFPHTAVHFHHQAKMH